MSSNRLASITVIAVGIAVAPALWVPAWAAAQPPPVWQNFGPPGGRILTVAVAPSDPDTVYAAGYGGMVKSQDGGESWELLDAAPASGRRQALAVSPINPRHVFLAKGDATADPGVGIYRSRNGGRTWAAVLHEVVRDVEIVPERPTTLYAVGPGVLYASRSGGATWEQLPLAAQAVALHPQDPDVLWVADFTFVYRSDDAGQTFVQLASPGGLDNVALAVSPADADRLWVLNSEGIFRSDDGGQSWSAIAEDLPKIPDEGLPGADIAVLAPDPENRDRLATVIGGAAFVRSQDGLTWDPLAVKVSSSGLAVAIETVTYFPDSGDRLLAGAPEGVYRSLDGGTTWTPTLDEVSLHPIDLVVPHPSDPGTLFVVDRFGDVLRTADGGTSWDFVHDRITHLAIHRRDPTRVWALHDLVIEPVLRSDDGGLTFHPRPFPRVDLPFEPVGAFNRYTLRALAADPEDPDTVSMAAQYFQVLLPRGQFTAEEIWRTTDGGETWQSIWDLPDHPVLALAIEPGFPPTVYAGIGPELESPPEQESPGLRISRDSGATWQNAVGLPFEEPVEHFVTGALQVLFLAGRSSVAWTPDGGHSFTPAGGGLPGGRILGLAFGPPADLWATVEGHGIFASANGGARFNPARFGQPADRFLGAIAVDAAGRRWAGTDRGVARLDARPLPCTPGPTTLCLLDGRFRVEVDWDDFRGHAGSGRTRPVTGDTGTFWFFEPNNLELMVKAIDGRPVNGHFWIFYGSLSNVHFDLTVTDTVTGLRRTFFNPVNRFASAGITDAFPDEPSAVEAGSVTLPARSFERPSAAGLITCGTTTNLCLQDQRFRVEVIWRDFEGGTGQGIAVPLTPDTGAFWFFDRDNLELMVKVIDGRPVNGHFWVFLGALSNVNFEVVVTDTANGRTWIRENPAGTFASLGDALAFPADPTSGGDP